MKNPTRRDRVADDLAMTSMIDVVFLLLVFFVWTSSFDRPERELTGLIAMPAQTAADITPINENLGQTTRQTADRERTEDEIVLRIFGSDDRPRYQVGALPIDSFSELLAKLDAIAKLRTQVILIIDPDDDVATAQCVEVFDAASSLGFGKVYFAVDAESPSERRSQP